MQSSQENDSLIESLLKLDDLDSIDLDLLFGEIETTLPDSSMTLPGNTSEESACIEDMITPQSQNTQFNEMDSINESYVSVYNCSSLSGQNSYDLRNGYALPDSYHNNHSMSVMDPSIQCQSNNSANNTFNRLYYPCHAYRECLCIHCNNRPQIKPIIIQIKPNSLKKLRNKKVTIRPNTRERIMYLESLERNEQMYKKELEKEKQYLQQSISNLLNSFGPLFNPELRNKYEYLAQM